MALFALAFSVAVGAVVIAWLGCLWLQNDVDSFLEDRIESLVRANPRIFGKEEG